MMTVEGALLADVIAHPGEDWPRLIYADRCEDNGRPERAEFVRVQLELARLGDPPPPDCGGYYCDVSEDGHVLHRDCRGELLRKREWELLAGDGSGQTTCQDRIAWAGEPFYRLDLSVSAWEWRRGFVESVALPAAAWVEHGPALARAAPLREVRLAGKVPFMQQWARYPGGPELSYEVPPPLYALLPGRSSGRMKCYRDDATALSALSAACLTWAKGVTP